MVVDHLEWHRSKGGVEGGVVAILGPGQPIQPRTLLVVGDAADMAIVVNPLRLAISLGVEGGAHPQLDAHKSEATPDIASEDGVMIADDWR